MRYGSSMYSYTTQTSLARISSTLRVRKIPLPWLIQSGLTIIVKLLLPVGRFGINFLGLFFGGSSEYDSSADELPESSFLFLSTDILRKSLYIWLVTIISCLVTWNSLDLPSICFSCYFVSVFVRPFLFDFGFGGNGISGRVEKERRSLSSFGSTQVLGKKSYSRGNNFWSRLRFLARYVFLVI